MVLWGFWTDNSLILISPKYQTDGSLSEIRKNPDTYLKKSNTHPTILKYECAQG
jgi:hypothetical protein